MFIGKVGSWNKKAPSVKMQPGLSITATKK
jgi:hypothetical protein